MAAMMGNAQLYEGAARKDFETSMEYHSLLLRCTAAVITLHQSGVSHSCELALEMSANCITTTLENLAL